MNHEFFFKILSLLNLTNIYARLDLNNKNICLKNLKLFIKIIMLTVRYFTFKSLYYYKFSIIKEH